MKERPILFSAPMVRAILDGTKTQTRRVMKNPPRIDDNGDLVIGSLLHCPYGQVGDQLWVRETFNGTWCEEVIYKADGGSAKAAGYEKEPKWKPSIFMPRSFSRIQLEITSIHVQRLNDISYTDAQKEGWNPIADDGKNPAPLDPKSWYLNLWQSINGAGSWVQNPWVWVIEFKRV